MGKLTRAQARKRLERTLQGLEPYRLSGQAAIRKGLNQQALTLQTATDHPGSKRRFGKLLLRYTDEQGRVRIQWPTRKRRGRQAAATGYLERLERYERQNGTTTPWRQVRPLSKAEKLAGVEPEYSALTSAQAHRLDKKLNHGLARAADR